MNENVNMTRNIINTLQDILLNIDVNKYNKEDLEIIYKTIKKIIKLLTEFINKNSQKNIDIVSNENKETGNRINSISNNTKIKKKQELFNPTYDFQLVNEQQVLPAGLYIKTDFNNTYAKISNNWNLRVKYENKSYRIKINRYDRISDVNNKFKKLINNGNRYICYKNKKIDTALTVEESDLFNIRYDCELV